MKNKTLSIGVFALILGMMIATLVILLQKPWQALGSVAVGNQYQATSTPQVADATNLCPARVGNASSTTGVLGSVNILKQPSSGTLTIYDATTTDATQRAPMATTSMILAAFPANATTSSYHFDIEFTRGLLIDYTATVVDSTISYRCEG